MKNKKSLYKILRWSSILLLSCSFFYSVSFAEWEIINEEDPVQKLPDLTNVNLPSIDITETVGIELPTEQHLVLINKKTPKDVAQFFDKKNLKLFKVDSDAQLSEAFVFNITDFNFNPSTSELSPQAKEQLDTVSSFAAMLGSKYYYRISYHLSAEAKVPLSLANARLAAIEAYFEKQSKLEKDDVYTVDALKVSPYLSVNKPVPAELASGVVYIDMMPWLN